MLDAATLLAVWEEADALPLTRKALALLHAAFPAMSCEAWAGVALGRRDWYLLYLRQQLFGEQLDAVASCPACGEKLETGFTLGQICPPGWELSRVPAHWQAHAPGAGGNELVQCPSLRLPMADGQHGVLARLPCSADVLASSHLPAGALLQRCVQVVPLVPQPQAVQGVQGVPEPQAQVVASRAEGGQAGATAASPDAALLQALVQQMQELDPLAEIRIDLQCPSCGHGWTLDFDIVQWLWNEIGDWAMRMMQQVHALAQAYGWSEASILAMSARRRRCYLEMLGYA